MARLAHQQTATGRRYTRKKTKLALVLAGGGLTGATYEIGALQALDYAFGGDFSVTDFDIVIGLSAGAFVGSLLVNGVKPADMFFGLQRENPFIQVIDQLDIYYPNYSEALSRSLTFPWKLLRHWIRDLLGQQPIDYYSYLDSFNELLPSGIFDNQRIEAYLRRNLSPEEGRTNDFRELDKELFIAATDLDTGERVIFGDEQHRTTPISRAVQASTALPLFYKPVVIEGREYTDGAIRKSLHIDVALKRGADLVICINPLVPFYHDKSRKPIPVFSGPGEHLSEKGMVSIAHQVMRILVHSRISSGLEKYRRQYPHADILLIEPRRDDDQMFSYKLMNYSDRLSIARHGYEETLEAFLRRFNHFAGRFRKHGIKLSRARLQVALNRIRQVPDDSYDLIERILYPQQKQLKPLDRLKTTLNTLERHLTRFGGSPPPSKATPLAGVEQAA